MCLRPLISQDDTSSSVSGTEAMSRVEGDVFLSYKPPEAPDWRKCKKRRRTGDDSEHAPAEEPLDR
jgi:hypothetical protein